jgi:hypothetical protein
VLSLTTLRLDWKVGDAKGHRRFVIAVLGLRLDNALRCHCSILSFHVVDEEYIYETSNIDSASSSLWYNLHDDT